jgi:hypothetical protein
MEATGRTAALEELAFIALIRRVDCMLLLLRVWLRNCATDLGLAVSEAASARYSLFEAIR